MKIEEGIIKLLVERNYQPLKTEISNMDIFYRADSIGTYIVLILRAAKGNEITAEEYRLVISKVMKIFYQRGFPDIHLLGLILTFNPERANRFCLDEEDHYIVDLSNRRLIMYENQSPYFSDIIPIVEDIIHDDSYSSELSTRENSKNTQWITPVNTVLVAANVIIHIIVHTGILGDTDNILSKGALSWYDIKERGEYYRIFTSMFLHSDFEHLMNNMLVLLFAGSNLEKAAGKVKYLVIYFISGIIAAISSISYNMLKREMVVSIGASGAIFGIVGAMGYILLINKGRLKDINGRQIILLIIFSLYGGIANAHIDNIAHIRGLVAGILLALLIYRKPKKPDEAGAS